MRKTLLHRLHLPPLTVTDDDGRKVGQVALPSIYFNVDWLFSGLRVWRYLLGFAGSIRAQAGNNQAVQTVLDCCVIWYLFIEDVRCLVSEN